MSTVILKATLPFTKVECCFRPTLRMSFSSDAVKLDDLMRRVEQVTGKSQSDIEKLAIFLYHFHADSRPGVAVRIQTMVLMKATYE
jgi:hypothetical protein